LALAKAGANLFIPSILDDDGTTKDLIEAEGVGHEFMKIDITEEGAPRKIIETCVVKSGAFAAGFLAALGLALRCLGCPLSGMASLKSDKLLPFDFNNPAFIQLWNMLP
jgi:hypothetical protein